MKNISRINTIKRFSVFGLIALCLAMTLALSVCLFSASQKANAAEVQTDIFSEDFDGSTFSELWKDPVNAELQTGEYSLRYDGNNGRWGACISPMSHKITGDTEISFDIQVSGGGWIAFVFGLPRYNSSMEYGDVGTWFFSDVTCLMDDKKGTSGGPSDTTMDDYAKFDVSPWEFSKASIRYVLTKKDEPRESDGATMYKLDLYMYEAGENCPSTPQATYDNLECDGYYGFSSMGNVKMTVTNFAVQENGKKVFEDNFTQSAFMFDNVNVPNAKWAVTYFDSSMLALGPTANVKIVTGKEDGSITNSRSITRDVRVDKQFMFSVEAGLSDISDATVFGMEFGNGEFFAGLEKTGQGEYRAVTVASGKVTETTASNSISDSGNVTIVFEGYHDGKIKITVDDTVYELKGGDFAGVFKVGTKHIGEAETQAGYVVFDNAYMQSYSYDSIPDAQDQAINFKGVRTYEESGETLYQYYVNENKWLMKGCTSPLYKVGEERNFVQFSESDVNTLFGPKQKYSEFICRFSITVTDDTAKNDTAILFSFGRKIVSGAAWDTPYLVFTKKTQGMEIAGGGGVSGEASTGEISFWNNRDSENDLISYNVMIVVIEGEIEVYFAPSDAPASEMSVLRGLFTYNDTEGYMAVAGHNGASFRIGSFAVTNINAENTNSVQDLTKNADVQEIGESLLLSGGAAATTKDSFDEFIMYVKVKPVVNGRLDVMLPNGCGITVSEGRVHGKGIKEIYSDTRTEDMLRGESGILCIRVQNNRLFVGWAASNEPIKLITEFVAEFELPKNIDRGELIFSSGDGSAILLEAVSVYSLDAEIEIATQDYDPDLIDDIDIVKPELGEENQSGETGCGSVVKAVSISVASLILVIAALVIVVVCRRRKRTGK